MRLVIRALVALTGSAALVIGAGVVATPATAAPASSFVTLLGRLPTDNSFHGGYQRALFKHWVDADRNGCNTRAEVLIAESKAQTTRSSTCTIKTGSWLSTFDGLKFTSASKLDIDHMVPLAEAWRSGAYKWNSARRQAYANDLGYAYALNAVSASSNRHKSDSDPTGWLPSLTSFRCSYAAQWIGVKYRWGLSVDSAERTILKRLLAGCKNIAVTLPTKA